MVVAQDASTVISKRFSQFHTLREELLRRHTNVPPLPSKFHLGDGRDPNFLVSRKEGLAKFLSACFEHDTIQTSPDFAAFLVPAFPGLWQATLEAYMKRSDLSITDWVAELDDLRAEVRMLGSALERKMRQVANARALQSSLLLWRDTVSGASTPLLTARDAHGAKAQAQAPPPVGSLRRATTLGPMASAFNVSIAPASKQSKGVNVVAGANNDRRMMWHSTVSLQHVLGLPDSAKDLASVRKIHSLPGSRHASVRDDAENVSLSGFTVA